MRLGAFLLNLLIAVASVGCGTGNPLGRKALSGTVTLDGAPLPKGAIELHPLNDAGVQSGALIEVGRYSIPTANGATPGTYRVVIYDTYESPPLAPGQMTGDDQPPPPKPKVPPDWNSKSKHEIEVKKDGPFQFNFDVVTKKK